MYGSSRWTQRVRFALRRKDSFSTTLIPAIVPVTASRTCAAAVEPISPAALNAPSEEDTEGAIPSPSQLRLRLSFHLEKCSCRLIQDVTECQSTASMELCADITMSVIYIAFWGALAIPATVGVGALFRNGLRDGEEWIL